MKNFRPIAYTLQCVATGLEIPESGWVLDNPKSTLPTLIRANYHKRHLQLRGDDWGLYTFADWLPINHTLPGSSAPVTYKSQGLAEYLGLKNLYITFNGYNPKIGATMSTCTFKETEAYSVCARICKELSDKVMVVASAGNTARAFAKVCSDNNIKLLLCIPEDNIDALWFDKPLSPCVKLIVTESGSDYYDAIALSNKIVDYSPKFYAEGGAKNIARRDGMACAALSAVTTIGTIPDYYFQAVGSGTGAIAAWEANLRLIEDGAYGTKKMKLMLSQNAPFTPIYNAWQLRSREMLPYNAEQARHDAEIIDAKVLSNRKPPYSVKGGLYDAMVDTDGEMFAISNQKLRTARELFQLLEGVDIYSASAVAVASLMEAIKLKRVDPKATIMLNITGGGEQIYKQNRKLWGITPSLKFTINDSEEPEISQIEALYSESVSTTSRKKVPKK